MRGLLFILASIVFIDKAYSQKVKTDTVAATYWKLYYDYVKPNPTKKEINKAKKPGNEEKDVLCRGNNYLTTVGFKEVSKQIFAKVIVGADGLPKEGTATSVAVNDEKSTIGGNANFSLGNNFLGNIGIAGTASGSQLKLFSENEYQKGFNINPGINYKLRWGTGIYYLPDSCHKVTGMRNAYFLALIKKIHEYEQVNAIQLINRIKTLRDSLSPLEHRSVNFDSLPNMEEMKKRLSAMNDSLAFLEKYVYIFPKQDIERQTGKMIRTDLLKNYYYKKPKSLDSILKNEIGEHELKNAITSGYFITWLKLNYSFANNAYNVFDTSATKNFSEAAKKEEYSTSSIGLSINHARVTKKYMLYLFGGISFGNRYALEDIKIENDTLVGKAGIYVPALSVKALDVSKFAETYNKSYNYFLFELGGFCFFGEKKIVGLEAYVSARAKMNVPELVDHRPTYSMRLGPLFSMTKDKGVVSNGTLGLMLQSNDFTPSRDNFDDRFSFAVRLSIPFSNLKYL
jgi:hypothetical protein